MAVIFLCLILFCIALALAVIFDRRIEGTIAPAVMLIVSLLYFSGFYGNLRWGGYAVIVLMLISVAYLLYCAVEKRKGLVEHFSPYFLFFLLFVVWLYRNYNDIFLSEWDEFSHWGLSTKIMCDYDKFSNEPGSTCYFVDYLPGTALFQYFMQKLNGEYAECCSVLAQGIFLYAFPFACLEKIKVSGRNMLYAGMIALGIFILPEGFYQNVYRSLYVDAALAVVFAYALFSYFCTDKKDTFYFFNLSLSLGVLCIIKTSGIGLMALVAIIIIGDNVITGKYKMLWRKKRFSPLALETVPFFIGWLYKFFWQLRLNTLGYKPYFDTGSINSSNLWKVICGNGLQYQKDTIENFCHTFTGVDGVKIFTGSFLAYILLMLLITFFIVRLNQAKKKRWIVFWGLSGFSFVIYSLYLLALYLFTYSEGEAVTLASFSRYEYTIILGIILSQVMLLFVLMANYPGRKVYEFLAILICIIFIVPNDVSIKINNEEEKSAIWESRKECAIADRMRERLSVDDKVYVIANGSEGGEYWVLKYILSPLHTQTPRESIWSWDIGTAYEGQSAARVDILPADWMNYLIAEGYQYVLLYNIDENFKTEYAEIFEDNNIAGRQMYFINHVTGKLEFRDI